MDETIRGSLTFGYGGLKGEIERGAKEGHRHDRRERLDGDGGVPQVSQESIAQDGLLGSGERAMEERSDGNRGWGLECSRCMLAGAERPLEGGGAEKLPEEGRRAQREGGRAERMEPGREQEVGGEECGEVWGGEEERRRGEVADREEVEGVEVVLIKVKDEG